MVFPDLFQAYVPDPAHPLPVSRPNVIVVAVAEYLPRARGWPFRATVNVPPFASFKTHFPLSSDGFSIVVEYVPTTLLDASATDETMSAPDDRRGEHANPLS